jgi:hypothetical protein
MLGVRTCNPGVVKEDQQATEKASLSTTDVGRAVKA